MSLWDSCSKHSLPSESRGERCRHWTKARRAPERFPSFPGHILILYSKPTRRCRQASKQGFTEVYVAVSRLLRATTHCFQLFLQVFLFQVAREVLANRQCKQCFKSLNRSINRYLVIVLFCLAVLQSRTIVVWLGAVLFWQPQQQSLLQENGSEEAASLWPHEQRQTL